MKTKLRYGHLGLQNCHAPVRQVMFWPGINAEIADMMSKYSTCLANQAYQKKEPHIFHEVPTKQWLKLGIDLFPFKGKSYPNHTLVVADYLL